MDKLLLQLKNPHKHSKYAKHLLTDPHRHWVIILRICFVMIFGLIVFNLYLLYQIKHEQVFQVAEVSEVKGSPIKEKLLNAVNASFAEKEKKTAEFKTSPLSYPDPSL